MTAALFPCPGCGTNWATADDGHHICRRCEGKTAAVDTLARVGQEVQPDGYTSGVTENENEVS